MAMAPLKDLRRMPEGSSPSASSAPPRTPLTGDERVDDLVAAHPELRLPLMSHGSCACCTGGLTLRQNAEVRGLPLAAVLEDLNREIAKGA